MASMKDALLSALASAGLTTSQLAGDRKFSGHDDATSDAATKKGRIAPPTEKAQPDSASRSGTRQVVARAANGKIRLVSVEYGQSQPRSLRRSNSKASLKKNRQPSGYRKDDAAVVQHYFEPVAEKKRTPSKTQAAPTKQPLERRSSRPEAAQPEVTVTPDARCMVECYLDVPRIAVDHGEILGAQTQLSMSAGDIHDLTIGLDFGTSTVKVVVTDASLEKSFAVPLCAVETFESYLLPSRLFEYTPESNKAIATYSLNHGDRVHRDLKLGLLGNPDSPKHREQVVAFLALVLRNVRAWLFKSHASVYRETHIVWRVAIGLPSVTALNNAMVPVLEQLTYAAWYVAGLPGPITSESIQGALHSSLTPAALDLEVVVLPEIAAQIYGFVISQRFDRKAANRFVMVDVGAGTIDSALFRVLPPKRGKWSFEFFTAVVQPFGVANLHTHRVGWWEQVLGENAQAARLLEQLAATKFNTDMEVAPPSACLSYFTGVFLHNVPASLDEDYFQRQVMWQVRGQTMWRAWKELLLSQEDLTGIPIFVCGGGSRMPFYARINDEINSTPGCSWLRAEPWLLDFPKDLVCEINDPVNFDRLSVAYGLSRLDIGSVTQIPPIPQLDTPQQSWDERYVSKDDC